MTFKIRCELCKSVLEGVSRKNIVCSCGEVILDGYNELIHVKKSPLNAVKIDNEGNPIQQEKAQQTQKPTREELIAELDRMRATFENLPPQAMTSPINHYDFASLLLLLSAILRDD